MGFKVRNGSAKSTSLGDDALRHASNCQVNEYLDFRLRHFPAVVPVRCSFRQDIDRDHMRTSIRSIIFAFFKVLVDAIATIMAEKKITLSVRPRGDPNLRSLTLGQLIVDRQADGKPARRASHFYSFDRFRPLQSARVPVRIIGPSPAHY